ncbi:MAG: rod shape-determining protein RodA [Gammaproteobacteria bacterium]
MDNPRGIGYRVHLDPVLLTGALLLCMFGLVVLYSASGQDGDTVFKQGGKVLTGLLAMAVVAQLPPEIFSRWAPWLYAGGLALLVAVTAFGSGAKGAQRWIDLGIVRFQPSELMKVFVPLMTCWYLQDKDTPPGLGTVLTTLAVVLVPAVLIARQPDLGTATLVIVAGLSVLFLAGIGWRYIAAAGCLALVSAPVLWYAMHAYQRQRLLTLFDPEQDPVGSGYHIIQSMIAVGSGGLYGKGWLNGTQSHLEFLPERSTDFIFAVFCEEFGLLGVLLLLAFYGFVIARCVRVTLEAQGRFSRLMAGSLTVTLFIYVFVNMGMVIGQLPVVGVPLPFVSYGGTSLVTLLASFGILMSFQTHRRLLSN